MGTKTNPGAFDCYENAEPDEPMFVLLARDGTAGDLVRKWADVRTVLLDARLGSITDEEWTAELKQIAEAHECADAMDDWRAAHRAATVT
jgi:hypothetical protein